MRAEGTPRDALRRFGTDYGSEGWAFESPRAHRISPSERPFEFWLTCCDRRIWHRFGTEVRVCATQKLVRLERERTRRLSKQIERDLRLSHATGGRMLAVKADEVDDVLRWRRRRSCRPTGWGTAPLRTAGATRYE